MNLLPCTVRDGAAWVGGQALALSDAARTALAGAGGADRAITLGVRPEFVECVPVPVGATGADTLSATVLSVRNMGTHFLAEFQLGDQTVAAKLRANEPFEAIAGSTVQLRFAQQRTLYYVNDQRVA